MPKNKQMTKRINISLPVETLRLLDRVSPRGHRSRLIDDAVRHYVKEKGRRMLMQQLAAGAKARAERDLALAEEWFTLEEEAWPNES